MLGRNLWNVLYDGMVAFDMSESVRLVAYADDFAVVAWSREEERMYIRTNEALSAVKT